MGAFPLTDTMITFSGLPSSLLINADVSFKTVALKEVHHLGNNVKNALIRIELTYQYPTAYSDDSVLKKIRKNMLTDFLVDVDDTVSQPEAAMKSYINAKIEQFDLSDDLLKDDEAQENGSKIDSEWKDTRNLIIRSNGGGLLSYTVESSQFSGGAHGGRIFRNVILDLKTGEKIGEEDLFTEKALPLINDILLKKLEVQNNVKSPEELEQIGYFDVTQIGQYKNFYLAEDGLVYTFNEYEIGAYALGTIDVKLTFQDLEGFLFQGSPLEKIIR